MLPGFKEFKKLSLEDQQDIESISRKYPSYSDFNFVSLYSYNVNNECDVCILNDNLVVKFNDYITQQPFLTFLGETRVIETIESLLNFSKELGIEEALRLVPEINIRVEMNHLQELYDIEADMDNFDYILSVEDMSQLKGNKFASKRKSTNKFKTLYPVHDIQQLDLADKSTQDAILKLFHSWAKHKNLPFTEVEVEYKAFCKLFEAASKFDLVTVGIFHNGELIGFTINEVIHDGHYMGHFGKINKDYPTLSSYLEHVTALIMGEHGCSFMNFQQDLGIAHLRDSKTSWRPTHHLKKYIIRRKSGTVDKLY